MIADSGRRGAATPRWEWVAGGYATALAIGMIYAFTLQRSGNWLSGLPWEHDVLLGIPRPLPHVADLVLLIVPWFGTNLTQVPLVLAAAAALLRRGQRYVALHLVVVQLGSWTLNPILKEVFERPRPDLWEPRGQFAWASYPSGHAIASVAVLFTVALLLRRQKGWTWPFAAASVILLISLYSRLYLGVHWPSDVIGGVLVGAAWLIATVVAFPPAGVATGAPPQPAAP